MGSEKGSNMTINPEVLKRASPPGHTVVLDRTGGGWVCYPQGQDPRMQPRHASYDAAVAHAWWRYRATRAKVGAQVGGGQDR